MFLWELKNAIISQNLRGLCVIKNPPTMASTSSATKSSITRCLSLSKAASKKPHNFITSSPRKIPLHSGFDKLSHQFFYYTLPEPVEGSIKKTSKLHHLITKKNSTHSDFDKLSHQFFYYTVPEPLEGTFLFLPVISTPLSHEFFY